jgi:hypothetical protein
MSDKQVFAAIVGGILSALLDGLLIVPITLIAHADGGDDGWGLLWIGLMILSGIAGLIGWAKWARRHINEFYQKGCQEKSSASTGDEMFSRDPAHGN